MWKDAWWLVGKELKFQWRAFVFTILATLMISLVATSILIPYIQEAFTMQHTLPYNRFLIDLIFAGYTPAFSAIFMSSPYLSLRTIKEDPFGKRMAVYRALPIPIEVLSGSRVLLMLVTLLVMSAVFYTTFFILTTLSVGQIFSGQELLMFILLWFGYSMAVGGLNTYIEVGTNGKMLWIFPFIFILLIGIAMILVYSTAGVGIVEWSFNLVRTYGWPVVTVSLLLGVAGCLATQRLLKFRLLHKDYI